MPRLNPRLKATAKRIHVIACAAVATCCMTQPALAVNETFSYGDGPLEGQGTSALWTGPWAAGPQSLPPTGTDPWQVQSEAVVVHPVDATIPYGFTESDIQRTLTTPFTGTAVYMSMLITPGDMGVSYNPNILYSSSSGFTFGFADGPLNAGNNGPMVSTFRYYDSFFGLYTDGFAISLNGTYSASNTVIGDWIEGQTYRLVGRLEFDQQGSQEKWTVWIDPVAETDVAAGSVSGNLGYSSISTARLYQFVDSYTASGTSMIDDLRIGESWDSVTAPIPPAIEGDLDEDGFVGISDLNIVLGSWNQAVPPGDPLADPSGDNFVGIADLNVVLGNWNAGTPPSASANVPEPGGLLILGLGGACFCRRSVHRASL